MLTSLLEVYPDDFEVLTALGTISRQVGRPDEARIFYRKALENDPGNQTLRSMLAELSGPVSAAEYRSTPAAQADSMQAFNLGQPRQTQTEDPEAEKLLELLRQNPRNAIAHNNLGLLRFRQGRFAEAAPAMKKHGNLTLQTPCSRKIWLTCTTPDWAGLMKRLRYIRNC